MQPHARHRRRGPLPANYLRSAAAKAWDRTSRWGTASRWLWGDLKNVASRPFPQSPVRRRLTPVPLWNEPPRHILEQCRLRKCAKSRDQIQKSEAATKRTLCKGMVLACSPQGGASRGSEGRTALSRPMESFAQTITRRHVFFTGNSHAAPHV